MKDNQHDRLLRLNQVLSPDGPIPVSPATWWRGVKSGRFPQPVQIGPRIRAWRLSDINSLLNGQ
ncbi:MAG: hypothetical protein B7Y01_04695 [Xanthobacter sp. 17-67-6]|nr:MAG: hypothetical protein B7Y01_04695 [Xanthobacter sp. 17-67-6]